MVSNEIGRQLHDRVTQGISLTSEEQSRLQDWYTIQDRTEISELGLAKEDTRTTVLQEQVEKTLAQLVNVTKRIQELTAENEVLRDDNIQLRQKLAHLFTSQPA